MAGLAPEAVNFFKFLLVLVLYSICMTLFVRTRSQSYLRELTLSLKNFLLACVFSNGGVAILLSALTCLYQMTFAGFFVHLNDIPPVLRWLQWLDTLKYLLEALAVNEVGSGLMIVDSLEGVPVNVSAQLIMNLVRPCRLHTHSSLTVVTAVRLRQQQLLPRHPHPRWLHHCIRRRRDQRSLLPRPRTAVARARYNDSRFLG